MQPLETRPHSHIMLIHVFGISGVLLGRNDVPWNHSVFVRLYSKNGHIDPKISKIIKYSEIFLPDTDDPLSSN